MNQSQKQNVFASNARVMARGDTMQMDGPSGQSKISWETEPESSPSSSTLKTRDSYVGSPPKKSASVMSMGATSSSRNSRNSQSGSKSAGLGAWKQRAVNFFFGGEAQTVEFRTSVTSVEGDGDASGGGFGRSPSMCSGVSKLPSSGIGIGTNGQNSVSHRMSKRMSQVSRTQSNLGAVGFDQALVGKKQSISFGVVEKLNQDKKVDEVRTVDDDEEIEIESEEEEWEEEDGEGSEQVEADAG